MIIAVSIGGASIGVGLTTTGGVGGRDLRMSFLNHEGFNMKIRIAPARSLRTIATIFISGAV